MPNENLGRDLQLRVMSLYVRACASQSVNLRQSVSVILFLHLLMATFWSTIGTPYQKNWGQDFDEASHVYLVAGSDRKYLTFTDDINLSRSQPYKITFWAISWFLLDKMSPNVNIG